MRKKQESLKSYKPISCAEWIQFRYKGTAFVLLDIDFMAVVHCYLLQANITSHYIGCESHWAVDGFAVAVVYILFVWTWNNDRPFFHNCNKIAVGDIYELVCRQCHI